MKSIDKLFDAVYEGASQHIDTYNTSGLSEMIEKAIDNYLLNIPEREQEKIIKTVVKQFNAKQKEIDNNYKKRQRQNKKVWALTKGTIPCICGCGNTLKRSKEEVLEGFNTIMCKSCVDAGKEFPDKFIYEVLGIK